MARSARLRVASLFASTALGAVRALAGCALALGTPSPAFAQVPPASGVPSAPEIIAPRLESDPSVTYPEGATGAATIRLLVTIAEDGSVHAAVPESSEEPFASVAAAAVLGWHFTPATRGGHPVKAKIRVEIEFKPPPPEPESEPEAAPPAPSNSGATPRQQPKRARPSEVIVLGERREASRSATLSRAEVRQLPGTFGDPFRAIETLPGVTPLVSGLPFFFVRGAPPGNVGYFLDGIPLPLLFHVGAGPSVVHPGIIERVDLYSGGYPARYGRFAGGIVAGETTPPKGELHGEYNLRLFDAGALVETPFAEGRGAALLGGRYSYTALLLSLLSPSVALDYWDYQARIGYDVTPRDRLTLFSFGSYDYLGQKSQGSTLTVFGTQFHRIDLREDHSFANGGTFRSAVTLGLDRSETQEGRFVRNRMAGTRTELSLPISHQLRVRGGTDLALSHYDVELGPGDLSPTQTSIAQLFPSRTDVALGARADVVWSVLPTLDVTPGVRVDLYGSGGATRVGVDPRLSLRTTLSPKLHLNAALGVAHQPPAFVVPLPGFQPGGLQGGLQSALQESLGVEAELFAGTTASATLFQNAFFDMSDPLGATQPQLNGCPPGTFPDDSLAGDRGGEPSNAVACRRRFDQGVLGPDNSGGPGQASNGGGGGSRVLKAFEVRTMGHSYGLELYLKRTLTNHLGGFFSYTLSRSTRSYGDRSYVATFDRTHVMNAALAYDLGRAWRAGTRVVFYTGLPQAEDPQNPGLHRLPPFFRLDLRLEKRWQLGREAWLSFVAEWMNATLSKEAVSTRCTLSGCEYQTVGPITIPSLGLEGGF